MKLLILFISFLLSQNFLQAVEFTGDFKQGEFIIGKTNPKSEIIIDKKKIRVSKNGYFAFGLGRDRKNDVVIKIIQDEKLEIITKKVYKKEYKVQRIDGLPKKQVTPPKEVYERIKKDNILIGKARSIDSELPFFKNKFIFIDVGANSGFYSLQIGKNFPDLKIIAYEPVWAIGTGLVASPKQAEEMHLAIRGWLTELYGTEGISVPLLYGGSVKAESAGDLFACDNIDGALIGGASLEAESLAGIVEAA